jgi:peptidoglycan/xylan/chitin deacetylase (PgdA/CDA1 family)
MTAPVYEPSRTIDAKIRRRLTQWRAAKPAWLKPSQPLLSISFDDFPISAAEHSLPVLAKAGVRGTFYACAGLSGLESPFGPMFQQDHFKAVIAAGHEIGCHTQSHLDCAKAVPEVVLAECQRNAQELAALGLSAPLSQFAYPYGEASFALKRALRPQFETARGIMPGLNIGRVDLMQLRAVPFYGEDADAAVRGWLTQAATLRAWLILFTHDVTQTPSRFGCSPRALAETLKQAKALGFAIAPVGEALAALRKANTP